MIVERKLGGPVPFVAAAIGGFAAAYLLVALVIFPSRATHGDAKVPNVIGLMFDDATRRLSAVGFKAERGEDRPHEASPKSTVLDQDPRAGERDPEGTYVRLTLSAGPSR